MTSTIILESERLLLRELALSDFEDLCKILQDKDVMYAYEGPFNDDEVQNWLDNQLKRYQSDGFGLYAVILKERGELIGQCGITKQIWKGEPFLEIGYLLQKKHWHQGYAIEAAKACKEYAFTVLHAEEVISIIRDSNVASQKVAKKNGMTQVDTMIKRYRNIDMLHYVFSVHKEKKPSDKSYLCE